MEISRIEFFIKFHKRLKDDGIVFNYNTDWNVSSSHATLIHSKLTINGLRLPPKNHTLHQQFSKLYHQAIQLYFRKRITYPIQEARDAGLADPVKKILKQIEENIEKPDSMKFWTRMYFPHPQKAFYCSYFHLALQRPFRELNRCSIKGCYDCFNDHDFFWYILSLAKLQSLLLRPDVCQNILSKQKTTDGWIKNNRDGVLWQRMVDSSENILHDVTFSMSIVDEAIWTTASHHLSQLVLTCNNFPNEDRHNPDFKFPCFVISKIYKTQNSRYIVFSTSSC